MKELFLLTRLIALIKTAVSVVSGRFFSIALLIVATRHFSVVENASFIFAITFPQLAIQLGTLGWLSLIRRELPRRSEFPPELFKGFMLRSFQMPMLATACIAVVILGAGAVMGTGGYLYICIAALTLCYALVFILREYLLALGFPATGVLAAETLPFAFASATIWLFQPSRVETAVLLFMLGNILSIAIQAPKVFIHLRHGFLERKAKYETRSWSRVAGFALLGFGGRTILDRLDIIILSPLAPAAELAYYNSAQRVGGLLVLVPVVLLHVFSPHVSSAFATGNIAQLRRDMVLQTFLIAACLLPLAAFLIIFPEQIIGFLFGTAYQEASSGLLGLIVFSQVMFAFSLPWSNLMLMTDGERIYGYAHIAVTILVLPIAVAFVDSLGAIAVALAASVANSLLFAIFASFGVKRIVSGGVHDHST
ncbi:lipopolysaccharide biosynthesis protein [Rhizobium leguminosarum]|uniref:lipopolysaccharide biosynthesis protein n=1 Tax=Rhizobium leguminosarum TaxID=384 RepID=UPI003F95D263